MAVVNKTAKTPKGQAKAPEGKTKTPERQAKGPEGQLETPEEKDQSDQSISFGSAGVLFSPEGIIMLPLAVILDILGLFALFIIDDYGILDGIGLLTIGTWAFFKSGTITTSKKTQKKVQDVGKKILERFGLTLLLEIIPIVGSVAPCWTIAVWKTLQEENG